jgi:hypothetical protein
MVTRQGNATTLSFFPGGNENSSEGGDELNSSLPDFGGLLVDDWFTGDFHDTLETDYDSALDIDRDLEEFPESFHHYRFKNRTEVEFDTPDGQTIDESSVVVTHNEDLVYVTLESDAENNPLQDSFVRSELGITQDKRKAVPRTRYHNWRIGTVNGIDALHTASIWGAYDPYVEKMAEYARVTSADSLWELLLTTAEIATLGPGLSLAAEFIVGTPAIWTWQEYTMLADGTELVRIWDVSDYPEHAGYLGNTKRDNITIEWAKNQSHNGAFDAWATVAQAPTAGPYQSLKWEYKRDFDGISLLFDETPLMAYGEQPNGTDISANGVNDMMEGGYAVDPF